MKLRALASLALALGGCVCAEDPSTSKPFACATDADCLDGYACVADRCVLRGSGCASGTKACGARCIAQAACCTDADCSVSGQTCTADACGCPAGQRDCFGACLEGTLACVPPPEKLVFTTPAHVVQAGACSPQLVVETQDASGQRRPVRAAVTVELTEQGMLGLELFSDATCSTSIKSRALAAGEDTVRFYARSTRAGMTAVQATATGLTAAQQPFTVVAGAPAAIAFTSPPQMLRYGACSQAVTLEAQDLSGNASPVSAAVAIGLTLTPSMGIGAYSNASCTLPLSSVLFAAGSSAFTFYVVAARPPGSLQIDAVTGTLGSARQTHSIVPGNAARVVFATTAQTVAAGACSNAVTLKLQDAQGTDTTAAASTTLTLSGASMTFFSGSTCAAGTALTGGATITAGTGQTTLYFKATTAGAVPLTVSGAGLMPATQIETVVPGPVAKLGFVSGPQGVQTSQCSGLVRLATLDAFDNPTNLAGAPLDVSFSAAPPTGFSFYAGGGCSSAAITQLTIPVGMNGASFSFLGSAAGQVTMTASSSLDPDPTQVAIIGVMPPSQLAWLTPPQTLAANACSMAATLEARDPSGQRSNVGAALAVTLTASGTTGFQFFSDPTCSTAVTSVTLPLASSQVSFWFKGTGAGIAMVTPATMLTGPGPQAVTIQAGSPSSLGFSTPARSAVAGTCTPVLTVRSRDAFGNTASVAADATLTLSGMPATGITFHSDSACATAAVTSVNIAAGMSGASFFAKPTVAPTRTVVAQGAGLGSASQDVTVTAGAEAKIAFSTPPRSTVSGACSVAVTVERRDAFDNPAVSGMPLSVSFTASAGGLVFFSAADCSAQTPMVSIPAAQSSVTVYTRGTAAGTYSITATAGALPAATQAATVTAGAPTRLVFTTPMRTLVAGACSPVLTVESRDSNGNPAPVTASTVVNLASVLGGGNITFYRDAACAMSNAMPAMPSGASTLDFYVKGTLDGSWALTATVSAWGGLPANQQLDIDAGPPTQLVFTTAAPSPRVQTCLGQQLTVRPTDAYGNVSPVTVATTLTPAATPSGGVTFFTNNNCATPFTMATLNPGASQQQLWIRGGNTPQPVMMTVSATGGLTPATQTATVLPGGPAKLVFTTAPFSVMAGECAGPITVEARDVADNPAPVGSNTNNFTASPATGVTFHLDAACSTNPALVSVAAGTSSTTFWVKGITGGSITLQASESGLTTGTQTLTVAPMVRTGTCAITSGLTTTACPIAPALNADLSKTFFVFQATSNVAALDDEAVRCALSDAMTLTCSRGGSMTDVNIRWYTVTRPTGLTVQHFPAITVAAGAPATTTQTIGAVNPAQTFLLAATSVTTGFAQFDDGRFTTARLASPTTVELRRLTQAGSPIIHSLQVVEWAGAVVERASVTLGDNSLSVQAAVPGSATPAFLLYSWRYGGNGGQSEICRHAIRGMPATSNVTFTRGNGSSACDRGAMDIEFERVRLAGHRIDVIQAALGPMVTSGPVAINVLDVTRSIPFFGGTTFAGQSMGETSDNTANRMRDAVVRASFTNSTTVTLQRDGASGTASSLWTLYVWQMVP